MKNRSLFAGTDCIFSIIVGKAEVNDTIFQLCHFQGDLDTATFRWKRH